MWGSGIRVLPAAGRDRQSRRSRGTVEHPRERMGQDTPALRYLDQVCRRSPSFLKVLLPMLLLHFEGEAGAQDPLGMGGDGVRGCRPRHRRQPGETGTLTAGVGFGPFLPNFYRAGGAGTLSPVLLTAGSAKKEMPSRAKPAASIRPSHVCGVLSP